MSDIFSAGFTALQTAVGAFKLIFESKEAFVKAEYQAKIAEAYSSLVEAYTKLAEAKSLLIQKDEEIRKRDERIRALTEHKDTVGAMVFEDVYYFRVIGDKKEGPFCPTCWDDKKKQIRLTGYNNGAWRCPLCKNEVVDKSWHEGGRDEPIEPFWTERRR